MGCSRGFIDCPVMDSSLPNSNTEHCLTDSKQSFTSPSLLGPNSKFPGAQRLLELSVAFLETFIRFLGACIRLRGTRWFLGETMSARDF